MMCNLKFLKVRESRDIMQYNFGTKKRCGVLVARLFIFLGIERRDEH
jgi:hypothetical protein